MGLPKGFVKKVNFNKKVVGPEKRQSYLDDIDYKGTYLPKGIDYVDIDARFIDFIDKDLVLVVDGVKVPVIMLTIQRFSEFSKTWSFTGELKNIKMPFITIVRQPDIQVGSNQAGIWNIPGRRSYTYIKVPTFKNGVKGIDTYKIPQPTSVDVTYEVKLFCNRMKDLNKFHKIIQKTFHSRQFYMNVNGHPIPLHLEKVSDESQKDNFDERRFYVQNFEIKALAYILDEEDYECIPSITKGSITFKENLGSNNKKRFTAQVSETLEDFRVSNNNITIDNTNLRISDINITEGQWSGEE